MVHTMKELAEAVRETTAQYKVRTEVNKQLTEVIKQLTDCLHIVLLRAKMKNAKSWEVYEFYEEQCRERVSHVTSQPVVDSVGDRASRLK